eukprot:144342-Prorocentrum_minimum.AAC.1
MCVVLVIRPRPSYTRFHSRRAPRLPPHNPPARSALLTYKLPVVVWGRLSAPPSSPLKLLFRRFPPAAGLVVCGRRWPCGGGEATRYADTSWC